MSFNVLLKTKKLLALLSEQESTLVSVYISICFKNNALFLTQNVSIQLELSLLSLGQTSNMNFLVDKPNLVN